MYPWHSKAYNICIETVGGLQAICSYLGIYSFIVFLVVATHIWGELMYTFGSLRASRIIHNKLVTKLLGSTFR